MEMKDLWRSDTIFWKERHISACQLCDKKAEFYLRAGSLFRFADAFLCKDHMREWVTGNLGI